MDVNAPGALQSCSSGVTRFGCDRTLVRLWSRPALSVTTNTSGTEKFCPSQSTRRATQWPCRGTFRHGH